jgi:hypothetical protein
MVLNKDSVMLRKLDINMKEIIYKESNKGKVELLFVLVDLFLKVSLKMTCQNTNLHNMKLIFINLS